MIFFIGNVNVLSNYEIDVNVKMYIFIFLLLFKKKLI
jgi:hypothetical protein